MSAKEIETTTVWLCSDCVFPAVYGDYSALDYYYTGYRADERKSQIDSGIDSLTQNGGQLIPDFEDYRDGHEEFTARDCDCCGSKLTGESHRFSLLTV